MSRIVVIILLACAFGALFILAEWLRRRRDVATEVTRKIVHIGTGLLSLLFPLFLHDATEVGALCGSFFIILLISMRTRSLPSINAINRKSLGSLLYPVSVFSVYLFYENYGSNGRTFPPAYYFAAPVIILAICDPMAAWAGSAFKSKYAPDATGKTLAGSFSFFFSAMLIVTALGLAIGGPAGTWQASVISGVVLAFMSTLSERFSTYGTDNLTIPASVMLGIFLLDDALKSLPA